MKVEEFKFVTTTTKSSTDTTGMYCDLYDGYLLGFMITDTRVQVFVKIDIPHLATIIAYGYDVGAYSKALVRCI